MKIKSDRYEKQGDSKKQKSEENAEIKEERGGSGGSATKTDDCYKTTNYRKFIYLFSKLILISLDC